MMRHVGVARTARQRKQQHFVAGINFYLLYAGTAGQRKWDTVLPIFLIILGIVSGLYLRSGGCDSEAEENPYNSKSPGWPRPVLL